MHEEIAENVPETDLSDLNDYQLARDRSRRNIRKPQRFDDFI